MDVFEKGQEVSVSVAEDCFVSTLEEVADGLVLAIKVHGVALVDTLKDFREQDILRFDEEMNMVGHENIGIEVKMIALLVSGEDVKIFTVVKGIGEYPLPLVASRDDMVEGAFVFYPRLTGHDGRIADTKEGVNNSIIKSDPIRSDDRSC